MCYFLFLFGYVEQKIGLLNKKCVKESHLAAVLKYIVSTCATSVQFYFIFTVYRVFGDRAILSKNRLYAF